MQGHNRRNSKTTLMYTIALAFLIFAGAGYAEDWAKILIFRFALQSLVIQDFLKLILGSEMTVFVPPTDKFGLDESGIR